MIYWYWPNCKLVLVKSYTCIGQIVYRNSQIWQWNLILVLSKLFTGIEKLYISIGEIIYQYWWNHITILMKSYTKNRNKLVFFSNTGIGFCKYWYTILSIPVYNFANASIQFCQYRYTISQCPKLCYFIVCISSKLILFCNQQNFWEISDSS